MICCVDGTCGQRPSCIRRSLLRYTALPLAGPPLLWARKSFCTGARTLFGGPAVISNSSTLMNNLTSTSPWQCSTAAVSPCSSCPGLRTTDTRAVFLIDMLNKMQPQRTVANYQLKSGLNDVPLLQISRPAECNILATTAKWRGEKMFAGHTIYNIYILYSGIINDNTLSSVVPILGRQNLYCVVLCCAVLYCVVLCCAVLCCALLCCAVLCCAVLCCVSSTTCNWTILLYECG